MAEPRGRRAAHDYPYYTAKSPRLFADILPEFLRSGVAITGSENWYRHGINRNVLYTDGSAECCRARWGGWNDDAHRIKIMEMAIFPAPIEAVLQPREGSLEPEIPERDMFELESSYAYT
jgi:hypothetical protein